MTVIYTQGSFDILHSGHMILLQKCKKLGTVVVALLTDNAYLKYRGFKPAKDFSERKAVLESLKYVDRVVACDNSKTKEQIKKIKPDWVVVGSDWVEKDIYKQWNVAPEFINPLLIFFPYTTKISTTMIKERIKNEPR